MLYKLASVLGFTALFMVESITSLIKYASLNMEQFTFIFTVDKANPFLGTALGLEYFFPLLFVILCLAAGCLATQWSIGLIELAVWAIEVFVDAGMKCYQRIVKSKALPTNE